LRGNCDRPGSGRANLPAPTPDSKEKIAAGMSGTSGIEAGKR
jgi:hypothetical protein